MLSRSSLLLKAGRVARAAPVSRYAVSKVAVAKISSSVKNAYEPIQQTKVPRSTYEPGSPVQRSTINVEEASGAPSEPEVDAVVPLTQEVYEKLGASLKKGTIMGKVVVVTGGARGLGNSMARACIEAGAKAIIILDANAELGDKAAAALHQATGKTIPVDFYKIDVRVGGAVNEAIKQTIERHGVPDVLINSAGIADSNIPAETYDLDMFRRLIDINLNGTMVVAQAVAKAQIAANKPGSLIFIASMSGSIVNYPQEQSAYNASKAGVVHLGRSLAAEFAKYNIRVNCISPGYMDTELNSRPALEAQKKFWRSMTPQARLGAPNELNGLAVYLASDSASFVTGGNFAADGGYTLL